MAGIVNKVFCLKIFVTGAVVSSAQTWGVLPPPPENSVEPQRIARAAPYVNTSVTTEVVQFFVSTVVCITRKQIATLRLRCRNTSQSSTGTQKTFILPP